MFNPRTCARFCPVPDLSERAQPVAPSNNITDDALFRVATGVADLLYVTLIDEIRAVLRSPALSGSSPYSRRAGHPVRRDDLNARACSFSGNTSRERRTDLPLSLSRSQCSPCVRVRPPPLAAAPPTERRTLWRRVGRSSSC